MTTGIDAALETLRHTLEAETALDVRVGRKHPSGDGLLLFPFRLSFPASVRRLPAPGQAEDGAIGFQVDFLLLAEGEDALSHLDGGLRALNGHPVVTHERTNLKIVPNDLSVEVLTDIFASADIDLKLSASYRVAWSG